MKAIERDARQSVEMASMLRQEMARPRGHRAFEASLRSKCEIAWSGRAGIADRIGEMADRDTQLRLKTPLALDDLVERDIRVALRGKQGSRVRITWRLE